MSDRFWLQRGNGSTGVVAIFAIAVVVILLMLVWWGFLAPGHVFGPANNNGGTINIVVSHKP